MGQTLQDLQRDAGATFIQVGDHTVPEQFGNEAIARDAVQSGVAVCDRSHWGRIEVGDADRIRFLHNQTTNDFQSLQPGQGCETVFVTSTARTIDLVSAYVLADRVLLLTSPGCSDRLMQWMDRYIFFADKVTLADVTTTTLTFSLLGPGSDRLLTDLGLAAIVGQPRHGHQTLSLGEYPVTVAVGSGLATPGYTLFASHEAAPSLWSQMIQAGAVPLGSALWETLRVEQGRPLPDHELTEDYNPLEAGLWHAVSFEKGCYIGQETIARLDTYKGVKQQLFGVRLSGAAEPGTPVMQGDNKIGTLTSVVTTVAGLVGLAYIRTKAGGSGLTVQIGDATGEVVEVPFLTRDRQKQAN
ncbi:MAG: folate-binding protein [Synechococcales bacterium]|nr:folate-binding protein [Synechococcales bacterium]